jgi:hypothetical protein
MSTTQRVRREAGGSDALDRGIRLGLLSYGLTHLVIAATALPLAWGDNSSGKASQKGAFSQMAQQPFGDALLWVIAVGFVCMTIWQAVEAAAGHLDEEGKKRVFKRVASGAKAVVYAVLAWTAANTALGSGSSSSGSSSPDGITAKLMSAPGGTFLVGLVGVVIVAVGGYLAYRGWAEKFKKRLDERAVTQSRAPIVLLGKVGYIAKGVALAVVGVLFVTAAVQHQPHKSGGLDVALHALLRQPFGPVLLAVVALGLACFGLYCFFWARYLKR